VKNPTQYIGSKLSTTLLTAVKLAATDPKKGGLLAMSAQLQSGMTPKQLGAQYAAAAADDVKRNGGPVQPNEMKAMEEFGAVIATIAKGAIEKYQGTRAAAQKSGTAGKQMKTWDDYIRLSADGNLAQDVRAAFTAYKGNGAQDDSVPTFVSWYNDTIKRVNGGKHMSPQQVIAALGKAKSTPAAGSKNISETRRRLNEDASYKLIDLLKDVCEDFNGKYKGKGIRARPGKYGSAGCVVVGGRGWSQVVSETDGAFKTESALKAMLDSIMSEKRETNLGIGTPRPVKNPDPAVVAAKTDKAIKVQIKRGGEMLKTPLVDSDPGVLNNIEDYSLYAVTIDSSR
jgi:hypothetical protein